MTESGVTELAQPSRVPSRFETILMFNQESKAFTGHYQTTHYLQYTPCILKFANFVHVYIPSVSSYCPPQLSWMGWVEYSTKP